MMILIKLFLQSVIELIKVHFGRKGSPPMPPIIPAFHVPTHEEPRFSCFVESEAGWVCLRILFSIFLFIAPLSACYCYWASACGSNYPPLPLHKMEKELKEGPNHPH